MSTTTPNLNLVKPAGNERALVSDINGNMDLIDSAVGDLQDFASRISLTQAVKNATISMWGTDGDSTEVEMDFYLDANKQNGLSVIFSIPNKNIVLYKRVNGTTTAVKTIG